MTLRKVVDYLVVALAAAQLLLILVSWFVTAAWPDVPMRSLLSSEGIRWLFGSLTRNLLTPVFGWLLFGSMAYGAVRSSGLLELRRPLTFRQRSAVRFVAVEIVLFLVLIFALTSIPHAPLLSVTGQLFPSSFSDGIVAFACIGIIVVAVTFGATTGRFPSVSSVLDALVSGIGKCGYLWLLYVLIVEFYVSLRYFLTN